MKTKLLLIMPSLYAGGAEKSFISMLPLLPRDKFDINVMIVHEGGLFYSRLPQDIKVIEAPKNLKIALGSIHGDFIKKKCNIWDKVCKIASNIIIRFRTLFNLDFSQLTWMLWKNSIPQLETHYDVAISYTNGITNYYVIDKINATKKILWVHTDFNKVKANHKFEYTYFSKADKVVTISLLCVKSLKDNFPNLKNKFICLENISSGNIIQTMANEYYPKEYNKEDDKTIKILSIGRLSIEKGFDLAIEASNILYQKQFNFKWFIIGVGSLELDLQNRIIEYKLQDTVYLLGQRSNPYPYIQHCDIFIQTSRFEGKSIVVDEAKILNKPIIATNYPSVSDNIKNNITGIICDLSPTNIAETIINLSKDKSKQKDLITNLNKMCNGNEEEIEKYIELFHINQ